MPGKHRKPSRLKVTLHATGGTLTGAAVVGVVATTANAAIVHVPGQAAAASTSKVTTSAPKPKDRKVKTQVKHIAAAPLKAGPAKAAPAPKKIRAADVIWLAERQVGVKENGSGETKFQDWYISTSRAKETVKRDGGTVQGYEAAAWCSMFISWLGDRLGFSDQMGADAWTIAHAGWFWKQRRFGYKPVPGAVVFFNWGGGKTIEAIDHVGLVVKDLGNGRIQTIEGNTSNAVMIKERATKDVIGYGYPDYAG